MKKPIQLLATLLITINLQLLTFNCVAQWTAVNTPNPVPQSLYTAVHFFDTSKGVVVGSSPNAATGTISTTNDAAQTWITPVVNTNGFFNDVHFPTVNTGYGVTILGEIVKSNDGGNTWSFQTSGTFNPLFGVNFITKDIGWAVGDLGTVLMTSDGGTTWNNISANIATSTTLWDVQFLDAMIGFVVGGDGSVHKTTDGGITWAATAVSLASTRGVHFVDANNGYMVGKNSIVFKTTDGGTTWTNVSLPNTLVDVANTTLNGLWFISKDTGYVVGEEGNQSIGYIIKTTDGGITWKVQLAEPSEGLQDIQFTSKDTGYAVGLGIYQTFTGGDTAIVTNVTEQTKTASTNPLLIYPNPANEMITIRFTATDFFEQTATFTLLNNLGQKVKEIQLKKLQSTININDLPKGMYSYVITSNQMNNTGKIIIQ